MNNSESSLMFPFRLKALLKYRKMTQSELATKLNIPFSTLNGYTRGKRMPNIDLVHQMCEVLNCSFDYLFDANAIRPSAICDLIESKSYDINDIGDILHIDNNILYGWAYGQFELDEQDYKNIADLLGVNKEHLISLTENIHWSLYSIVGDNFLDITPTIITKIQHLYPEELEDVEKYIDFIISKRKP